MGFSRIQSGSANNGAVTLGSSVTAGSLLVIKIASFNAVVTGISGNSNTYVQATSAQGFNATITEYTDIWYVLSANSGSTTVTVTTTAGTYSVHVREYSVTGGTPALDVATNGSGNAFSTSLSLTTATPNELLCSMVAVNTTTGTLPSSWADLVHTNGSFDDFSGNLEDAGAAGSVSANWTGFGSSSQYAESFAAFKITGGGGGTPTLSSISPTSGYANSVVNSKLIGVALVGTNMGGSSPQVNVPAGFAATNLVVVGTTAATFDLQINTGKTPGAYTFTFQTTDGTSGTVSFTVSNPSGSGSLSPDSRGGFDN
jgi:hypothetical protein